MLDTRIEGLDGVLKAMRELGPKIGKKAANAALRKGAAIVRKAAVAGAKKFDNPATASNVSKEIVTRTGKAKKGDYKIRVGVKGGAKAYVDNSKTRKEGRVGGAYEGGGNVYYWRFLEFGTSQMAAQPFMRPALENNVQKVTNAIATELNVQIDKLTPK